MGYYNPVASEKEQAIVINAARLEHWVSNGARVSDTVARLVKQAAKAA